MKIAALLLLLAAPFARAADVVQPGTEGVWAKFDFAPGDKTLFFEDFAAAGKKAPKHLKDPSERLDVVERDERSGCIAARRARSTRSYEKLPARFTVEFDLYAPNAPNGLSFRAVNATARRPRAPRTRRRLRRR